EDGRVGADTERQGQDDRAGKSGIPKEHAAGVPQVPPERIEGNDRLHCPSVLTQQRSVAELPPGGLLRGLRRQPLANVSLGQPAQVVCDLGLKLRIVSSTGEQTASLRKPSAKRMHGDHFLWTLQIR